MAIAWPGHSSHEQAERWFVRKGSQNWATCPFTQAAFVRLLSNPSVNPRAVAPLEAIRALQESTALPEHHFWPDDIPFAAAVEHLGTRLIGYRQATDAYLLGLAVRKKGVLATLDARTLAIAPEGTPARVHLEIIK